MSTPSRFARWRIPILNERLGYAEPQEPDPDPEDPTDYASVDLGGAVQVAIDIGTVAKVQDVTSGIAGIASSSVSATFSAPTTEGNTVIAVLAYRGTSTAQTDPTGWTKHSDVQGPAFDGGRLILYSRTAGATPFTTLTIGCSAARKQIYMAEWSGLGPFDLDAELDNQAASTTMTTSSLTPTASGGVLFAGFNQSARNPSIAVQSPFTEEYDSDIDASGPSLAFGSQIVASFSGSYTATATSSQSEGFGAFIAAFSAQPAVWTPGPGANDGDDATYAESDAEIDSASLRIALDVERLIYRAELLVGCASSGSTTYDIYGSDDAEFTSPVLLDSVTFTATGSFTGDDVVFSWIPTASYQYYELRGTDSARRFYDLNMFSTTSIIPVSDHPLLTGREDADQHPTGAISNVTISPSQLTADTDNWNPTGLTTADVIRLSTDASRNITGIVAPTVFRRIILENVGSNAAVLVHDATSTAANRFLCPGSTSLTLDANASVEIAYDDTSDRWRVIDPAAGGGSGGGYPATASPSLSSNGDGAWDTDDYQLLINDSQRNRSVSNIGWVPSAYPAILNGQQATSTSSFAVASNGGTLLIPMHVKGHMLLQSVRISQQSNASARQWGWDLYLQDLNNGNSGENTLRRIAASNGDDSFTPGAASLRTLDVASAPVYLAPGIYWLAIQCTHATNNLTIGYQTAAALSNTAQTKTTTNPNGSTLDAVAATWTKQTDNYFVVMLGRVFGQTTAF